MKLPPAVEKAAARFDRMTLRERALVIAAALTAIGMLWMMAVLDPINSKQRILADEIATLQSSLDAAAAGGNPEADALGVRLAREKELQAALDDLNAKLASTSHGLIPPERMVQVIRDVLGNQHGITLIGLHNKPMTSLLAPASIDANANPEQTSEQQITAEPAADAAAVVPEAETGPYMHPVEIVVQGSYLDVLAYLRALEALPWHFYWKVLELRTTEYPTNIVRIELGTLSMDKEWLGV